jgi:hypothetical protein
VIKLGMEVRFTPAAFFGENSAQREGTPMQIPRQVTGKISYINEAHRYYTVDYEIYGVKLRESFKF